ncbi:MAG: putative nucleic acid-binding protein [Spirosomataceae bacterium]|jgi:hypothetical protein
MEPVSTTVLIGEILVKYLSENNSVKSFLNELTDESVKWLKPFFLREDESPTDLTMNIEGEPANELNIDEISTALKRKASKTEDGDEVIKRIYAELEEKFKTHNTPAISVKNSKNVNTGNLNSGGGNINIGDR